MRTRNQVHGADGSTAEVTEESYIEFSQEFTVTYQDLCPPKDESWQSRTLSTTAPFLYRTGFTPLFSIRGGWVSLKAILKKYPDLKYQIYTIRDTTTFNRKTIWGKSTL